MNQSLEQVLPLIVAHERRGRLVIEIKERSLELALVNKEIAELEKQEIVLKQSMEEKL